MEKLIAVPLQQIPQSPNLNCSGLQNDNFRQIFLIGMSSSISSRIIIHL